MNGPAVALGIAAACLAGPGCESGSHSLADVHPPRYHTEPLLRIMTKPRGAAVSLNGVRIGEAPLEASLKPGTFRLVVELDGYSGVIEHLQLVSGASETRDYDLVPSVGSLEGQHDGNRKEVMYGTRR